VPLGSGAVEVPAGTAQAVTVPVTAEGAAALNAQLQLASSLNAKAAKLKKKAKKLLKKSRASSGDKAKKLKKKAKKLKKKAKKLKAEAAALKTPGGSVRVDNPRNGASQTIPVTYALPGG